MGKKPKFNIGDKVIYDGLILTITHCLELYGQIYYAFDHDKLKGIIINEQELIAFQESQNLINEMVFPHLYPGDCIQIKDLEGNWTDYEVIDIDENKVHCKAKNFKFTGSYYLPGLIKEYNRGEVRIIKGDNSKQVEKEMNDFLKKVWINYSLDKYNETKDRRYIEELRKIHKNRTEEN